MKKRKEDPIRDELFSRSWRSDDPMDADAYDQYCGYGKYAKKKKKKVTKRKKKA